MIQILEIPDVTHVPEVTLRSVRNLLRHQTGTTSEPDGIPYQLWRDYADYQGTLKNSGYFN